MTDDPMYEPTSDADDVRDAVRAGYIPADSVYCEHGTFVGTPGGPDYICGWCEDGISQEEREAEGEKARAAGHFCDWADNTPDWVIGCTRVGPCPHQPPPGYGTALGGPSCPMCGAHEPMGEHEPDCYWLSATPDLVRLMTSSVHRHAPLETDR